jgi:hypothetical protein
MVILIQDRMNLIDLVQEKFKYIQDFTIYDERIK